MSKPRAEVSLRFSFGKQYPALDQRTVRLLELIEEHLDPKRGIGAQDSYRTAWTLISNLNRCGQGAIVNAMRWLPEWQPPYAAWTRIGHSVPSYGMGAIGVHRSGQRRSAQGMKGNV